MTDTDAIAAKGGCACRSVRFRLTAKPMIVHCCHCRWCQRETGTAFALNAMVERERVELLAGEPETVDTPSESGKGQRIVRCRLARWRYGATTLVRELRLPLSGWEHWMTRTHFRRTFISTPPPSSPGCHYRAARVPCRNITMLERFGRRHRSTGTRAPNPNSGAHEALGHGGGLPRRAECLQDARFIALQRGGDPPKLRANHRNALTR